MLISTLTSMLTASVGGHYLILQSDSALFPCYHSSFLSAVISMLTSMLTSTVMASVCGHHLKCANDCSLFEVMNATTSENALMRGLNRCATLNDVPCRYVMWNDSAPTISYLSSILFEANENCYGPMRGLTE